MLYFYTVFLPGQTSIGCDEVDLQAERCGKSALLHVPGVQDTSQSVGSPSRRHHGSSAWIDGTGDAASGFSCASQIPSGTNVLLLAAQL